MLHQNFNLIQSLYLTAVAYQAQQMFQSNIYGWETLPCIPKQPQPLNLPQEMNGDGYLVMNGLTDLRNIKKARNTSISFVLSTLINQEFPKVLNLSYPAWDQVSFSCILHETSLNISVFSFFLQEADLFLLLLGGTAKVPVHRQKYIVIWECYIYSRQR